MLIVGLASSCAERSLWSAQTIGSDHEGVGTVNGVPGRATLLRDLEPVIEQRLERHLRTAQRWDPSAYVRPELYWGQRRSSLTETAKAALITTLLTHNNTALADPARELSTSSPAWAEWSAVWSDEKRAHADAIQRYLVDTRSVDSVALDRARVQCTTIGIESSMEGDNFLRSIVHSTIDVMATMVSHRNTAVECADPVAEHLLERIVADQARHVAFFSDVVEEALKFAPAETLKAITEVLMNFQLPGSGLVGFERSAMLLARDGIYDLRQHLDDVLLPAVRMWRIFDRSVVDPSDRNCRILSDFLDDVEVQATTFEQLRIRARARDAARLRAS